MKRCTPWLLSSLILIFAAAPFALGVGSTNVTLPAAAPTSDRSVGAPLAAAISTVTGMAISPLLGTAAYGAYRWYEAKTPEQKAALPWYAQWSFFGPALAIVLVCAVKDALGTVVPPALKKPLDVLETFENKISGLVAAGAVVPFTMASVSKILVGSKVAGAGSVLMPSGLAMIHLSAIDFSGLLNILTVPFGVAMFVVVWMASHAINVLILLSPWGAIDAALKGARTGLLGLLTLTSMVNPWIGAGLSLVIILISWLVSGWAFRLTWFGSIFCWDFFTVRRTRFSPKENDNKLFAGGNLPGVLPRTYGRLVKRSTGALEFFYRPWLMLPEKVAAVPAERAQLAVGRGLFLSSVMKGERDTLFILPPRYHGHEEAIVRSYVLGGGVRDAGLRKAWSVMKELFGGSAAQTQVV